MKKIDLIFLKNRIKSAISKAVFKIKEISHKIGLSIRHNAVIIGMAAYDKVLVPVALVCVGLFALLKEAGKSIKHYGMCFGHDVIVKIGRLKANRFVAVAVMSFALVLVMSTMMYSVGIKIMIDGELFGYVMEEEVFEEGLAKVENQVSEVLGRPYTMNPNAAFSIEIVQRDKVLDSQELRNALFTQVTEITELYILTVDGEVVGASASETVLKNMLDEVLNPSSDPNVKTEFNREVKIEKGYAETAAIRSYAEMKDILKSNVQEAETYKIKTGDTLEKIAKKNGITKATLLSYNPGLNPGRLMAGERIVVKPAIPFLSVTQTRRVEYIEEIAYKTVEIKDSSIYRGSTKVKTKGVKGQNKIVADVVYKDNQEISRTIISKTLLREPVTKEVLVGTKTPPAKAATGKMRRPVTGGYISSNYGYRRSEFHTGVDFAISYGSKVVAADGGTVSFSGWKGAYGYLVIINHGNGLQTYYAHNSKLLVKAGQKVGKGEQIAKIGSTGRSSGPHCHFEVRVNGKHVSPWRYIS